uniref:GRIP domain-containing protein n=1 Tax=Steinernema glaseri TaxID=37863 RepID=A0A1I7ZI60_9BILA
MSKAELVKRIEEQHQQLLSYEKKLKDVVKAYKNLDAEKQALQATIASLSEPGDAASESDPGSGEEGRIESLRKAVATLTSEQSKKEAAFLADKRALHAENEKLKKNLAESAKLQQKLESKTSALRQLETLREKELEDHGAILSEIQQNYGKERTKCEQLERQISELYKKLHDTDVKAPLNDKRMKELQEQLNKKDREIAALKKKAEITPTVQMLKDEIANLKVAHETEIAEIRSRTTNHSDNMRTNQSRVQVLELKLEELTTQIAQQEFDKGQMRTTMDSLRLKLEAAERENAELLTSQKRPEPPVEAEEESVEEKLRRYKSLVHELEASHTVDVTDVPETRPLKLAQEAVDSGMCSLCESTHADFTQLKTTVGDLRSKLQATMRQLEESETKANEVETTLSEKIVAMEGSHASSLKEIETKMRDRVNELESEMQKQRHRTIEVIAEKEKELEATKAILISFRTQQMGSATSAVNVPADPASAAVKMRDRSKSATRSRTASRARSSGSFDAAPIPESPSSITGFGGSFNFGNSAHLSDSFAKNASLTDDSKNVYYEEIISEKDREIFELRMKIRSDESKLRDLEHGVLTKDLQHYEIVEKLKEELRALEGKLELFKSNSEPSIEYLRNIFVQYLQCSGSSSRRNILKAMATVLKLGPAEMRRIESIK